MAVHGEMMDTAVRHVHGIITGTEMRRGMAARRVRGVITGAAVEHMLVHHARAAQAAAMRITVQGREAGSADAKRTGDCSFL